MSIFRVEVVMPRTVLFWPRWALLANLSSSDSDGMKVKPRKHKLWTKNSRGDTHWLITQCLQTNKPLLGPVQGGNQESCTSPHSSDHPLFRCPREEEWDVLWMLQRTVSRCDVHYHHASTHPLLWLELTHSLCSHIRLSTACISFASWFRGEDFFR